MTRRVMPLLLGVSLAACGGGDDDAAAAAGIVAVQTVTAAARDFPQIIAAIGTVTPRPGRFAALGAPEPTRVARIFVAPGQRVRAGAPLIEFERAPFEAAAHSAEAALAAAQANRDRAVRLAGAGVLPRRDADQAEAELAQAQAAAVSARRALELATLHAPLSGVVTAMTAVIGQPADPAQPLVEIVDPAALDIVFDVSPDDAARIRPGAAVTVTAGGESVGDSLGTARVDAVAAALDSASRAVPVRARLARPARALRVGETVTGRIDVGVHRNAVTVPAAALVPEGDAFKVFVVGADSLARVRSVVPGARADSLVEILSGLAAGERVVAYGAYGLTDGVKVVQARP